MAQLEGAPEQSKALQSIRAPLEPTSLLYERLRSARSIRLLRLHPRDVRETVICDLYEACLDDLEPVNGQPQYEALSYAWGTELDSHYVLCNNSPVFVSRNLHSALSYLQTNRPRILWADAICINQHDVPEKNVQVPLMGEVYRRAHTIVWLGTADDSEDGAYIMSLLPKFARAREIMLRVGDDIVRSVVGDAKRSDSDRVRKARVYLSMHAHLDQRQRLVTTTTPSLVVRSSIRCYIPVVTDMVGYSRGLPFALKSASVEFEDLASLPWSSIYAFFRRSWFQRVWVNQEIALGFSSTVRVGEQSLDLADLEAAIGLVGGLGRSSKEIS